MAKPRKTKDFRPPKTDAQDDVALWRSVTENVMPLPGKKVTERIVPETDTNESASKPETNFPQPKKLSSQETFKAEKRNEYPELVSGVFAGLDKRTAQRLKRGQLKIDARLDLHRLTQEEAHRALIHFIGEAVAQDKRTVIVITGKGLKASGEVGVLRTMVPRWLNQPPLRAKIVAFCEAAPKDGGSGALYLRLRKSA